jgi:hypothetical protein
MDLSLLQILSFALVTGRDQQLIGVFCMVWRTESSMKIFNVIFQLLDLVKNYPGFLHRIYSRSISLPAPLPRCIKLLPDLLNPCIKHIIKGLTLHISK